MSHTLRKAFRDILEARRAVRTASVSNPASVRLAAGLGYEAAMLAGSVAALEVLGSPDLVLLSSTDLADQTRRLCRVAEIPILIDADHGYGNALNVMRTVEDLAGAGAAGITIEDTDLPQKYAQSAGDSLIPLEEGLDKLRAALQARKDSGIVICARTSAARIAGTEEAIRRVRAYEAAGPDAIFLSGISGAEQLRAIVSAVSLPVILGAAGPQLCDEEVLRGIGVSLWLQGHAPSVEAIHSMQKTYSRMKQNAAGGEMKSLTSDELVKDLVKAKRYAAWMNEYMKATSKFG
jgi:carboxyvinyl-carboxyphosphonate phosphorylmutase